MSTRKRRGRERPGRANVTLKPKQAEAPWPKAVDAAEVAAGRLEKGDAMATSSLDATRLTDLEGKVSRILWTGSIISVILGGLVSVFGVMSVNAAFTVNSTLATLANDVKHLQQQSEKTEKRIDVLEGRIMDRFDALQKQLGERPAVPKAGP